MQNDLLQQPACRAYAPGNPLRSVGLRSRPDSSTAVRHVGARCASPIFVSGACLFAAAVLLIGASLSAVAGELQRSGAPLAMAGVPDVTIEQLISPAFPYNLVAARRADRIAWIENERGRRNVFTAASPGFEPVQLTATSTDDAIDLRPMQISDDGAIVVYIRGHAPGIGPRGDMPDVIANPALDPAGGTNEVWAVPTSGERKPWRVVSARNFRLSPDGRHVLFVKDGRIHCAPVNPGAADTLCDRDDTLLIGDYGINGNPVWSPGGRRVAFVSVRDDHSFVGVFEVATRRLRYLAPGVDRDSSPAWSPDGNRIAFLREPGLPFTAWADAPAGGEPLPDGLGEARFGGGNTQAVWIAEAASGNARELWRNPGDGFRLYSKRLRWIGGHILPRSGGNARLIAPAPPAEFPIEQHVVPESIVITADDGVRSHAQVMRPSDLRRGERRPALLFIHGGPRQQTLLGYHHQPPHGFYHLAYAMSQYFVNKGYVTLSVNYRSGIGYGREFREAPNRGAAGNAEYRDVRAAGTWLRDRAYVDAQRIGVWGLSYGGMLATQALARDSDLFASGVSIGGFALWEFSLDPASESFRASPVAAIDDWRSPVLLIHGDDDRNVNFSYTVALVQLLRARDIPHELTVFPNETHYFQRWRHWVRTFQAMDGFFDRTLLHSKK